jgi:hypothetical protein
MASARLAEYHVPGSTIPNMHYQSALQLGPRGWRYTHAETQIIHVTAALPTKNSAYFNFYEYAARKSKSWQNL